MNNRLKFRAVVTASCYDEEDNDIDIDILLEDVDVLNSGAIGVFTRYLSKKIEQIPNLTEHQIETIMDNFKDNSCSYDNDTYITIAPKKILQFIGLSDKSRKPIYEGDIVSDGHYNMEVYFDETYVRYAAKKYSTHARKKYGKGSFEVCFFMDRSEDGKDTWYKVVGNIYENKELLNVKKH